MTYHAYDSTIELVPHEIRVKVFPTYLSLSDAEKKEDAPSRKEPRPITAIQKKFLDRLCRNITYPTCHRCARAICGSKELCHCPDTQNIQMRFQQEYLLLLNKIDQSNATLNALKNSPFRQSRNAYGFAGSITSFINIILSNALIYATSLTMTTVAAISLSVLFAPALLIGLYVYHRGYREEQLINQDANADLMEKQFSLFRKHRDSVVKRYSAFTDERNISLPSRESEIVSPDEVQISPKAAHSESKIFGSDDFFLNPIPKAKLPPIKEKRGILGNPFSHFIGGTVATLGILNISIKCIAVFAACVAGPISLAVAGVFALGVGMYFGYKRYSYLKNKIKHDESMALLSATESDLQDINKKMDRLAINKENSINVELHHRLQRQQTQIANLIEEVKQNKQEITQLKASMNVVNIPTPPVAPVPELSPAGFFATSQLVHRTSAPVPSGKVYTAHI